MTAVHTSIEGVLSRITELAPLIRDQAADGESNRRVGDDTIAALKEAGAFSVATPRRYGGLETSLRSMLDVSAAVAEADGGSAWVVALSNGGAWITAALNPQQTLDEVFADGPDVIICGVHAPNGQARRVAGGYRVSGSWGFASGCLHAQWAGCGVMVLGDDDQPVDMMVMLFPRADFDIKDTWYVAGMRASGSNTIVADDIFIPAHRAVQLGPPLAGANVQANPDSALYRSALSPILVMVLIGPQLGLARAALKIATTKAAAKSLSYTNFARQADSVAFQLLIAEAASKIDTAHLHAYRAADDVQRFAEQGVHPDELARARIRADAAVALTSIKSALNTLLDACGAGSFAEVNPMQRIWRDSTVGASHAVITPRVSMETYGKALLGVHEHITPIL
jgi:3-hydroxy-9,10-secoandrosta-1,3,5(10)-triene-9,17-dione monooxygenase